MIVGNSIDTLEVPHEPGNRIKIRQLSGLEMDEAADIRSSKIMRKYGSIGKEAIEVFRTQDNDARLQQIETNPIDDYDHRYLVTHAIVGWEGPEYDNVDVKVDDNKANLDDRTLKWIVGEIVRRNHVPLGTSLISGDLLRVE